MKFNGKLPAALIWGIAIGLFISLLHPIVIRTGSNNVFYIGFELPLGWLIIGAFSFFYLRSIRLGGVCGATAGVTSTIMFIILNFRNHISHNHPSYFLLYMVFYMVAGIFWGAVIYSLPGIIGGWLYERKQTKN